MNIYEYYIHRYVSIRIPSKNPFLLQTKDLNYHSSNIRVNNLLRSQIFPKGTIKKTSFKYPFSLIK